MHYTLTTQNTSIKAPTFNFWEGPNQILLTPILEISNELG